MMWYVCVWCHYNVAAHVFGVCFWCVHLGVDCMWLAGGVVFVVDWWRGMVMVAYT